MSRSAGTGPRLDIDHTLPDAARDFIDPDAIDGIRREHFDSPVKELFQKRPARRWTPSRVRLLTLLSQLPSGAVRETEVFLMADLASGIFTFNRNDAPAV